METGTHGMCLGGASGSEEGAGSRASLPAAESGQEVSSQPAGRSAGWTAEGEGKRHARGTGHRQRGGLLRGLGSLGMSTAGGTHRGRAPTGDGHPQETGTQPRGNAPSSDPPRASGTERPLGTPNRGKPTPPSSQRKTRLLVPRTPKAAGCRGAQGQGAEGEAPGIPQQPAARAGPSVMAEGRHATDAVTALRPARPPHPAGSRSPRVHTPSTPSPSPRPPPPARPAAQRAQTVSRLPRSARQHGSDCRRRVT